MTKANIRYIKGLIIGSITLSLLVTLFSPEAEARGRHSSPPPRVIHKTVVVKETRVVHKAPQQSYSQPQASSGTGLGSFVSGALGGLAGAAVYDAVDDSEQVQQLEQQVQQQLQQQQQGAAQ